MPAGVTFAADVKEISEGGFSVYGRHSFERGTRARFLMLLPREATLEVWAEVVWSRLEGETPGMGLRFVETDPTRLEMLHEVVRRLDADSQRL